MTPLTRKQAQCLTVIREYREREGVPPSFEDIRNGLGLSSIAQVHGLVHRLEERGAIRSTPKRARSIEIIADDPLSGLLGPQLTALVDKVAKEDKTTRAVIVREAVRCYVGDGQ